MSILSDLADWIVSVQSSHVPKSVRDNAELQLMSVLAALLEGAQSSHGQGLMRAVRKFGSRGSATTLPHGNKVSPHTALLVNAGLSMVHDYDDYLFMGHTGHSAVLTALAVGEDVDAALSDVVTAQVIANEVAGRFGAYVAIGPQNGQLWAHIHLAASVSAAAKLYGLTTSQTAHALALAFYMPPFASFPGFFGSDAKVLTAAVPASQGVFAVNLATEGFVGAADILEHPRGFASQFAFVPMPEFMGGLGTAWVTDSLSFKTYPGCAYIDGPVDATLEATNARSIPAAEIAAVEIRASAVTNAMESLCEEATPAGALSPIAINFSAKRSVAIALLAGRLTPAEITPEWIGQHADDIREIAGKVRLTEDRSLTLSLLEGISDGVDLPSVARGLDFRTAWRARSRLREGYSAIAGRDNGSLLSALRGVRSGGGFELLSALVTFARDVKSAGPFQMSQADFRDLKFRFGAHVAIELHSGERLEASQSIPIGGAGRPAPERREVVERKLVSALASSDAAEITDTIKRLLSSPEASARELADLVAAN